MGLKSFVQGLMPADYIARKSILAALREQNLLPLFNRLKIIVPDIIQQYSSFALDTEYRRIKVRGQHSFQIDLVNQALRLIGDSGKGMTIIDIGDSSGTHLRYIKSVHEERDFRCLSVNMDEEAVTRIRQAGLEAIHARAEELEKHQVDADVLLSFAMLEHLINPCGFLHSLSENTTCRAFVVSVPYVAQSRMGLRYIRLNQPRQVNAESTHIFELAPDDWRLVFQYSGWEILAERIYYQYPQRSPLTPVLKNFWRRNDFEGFYGAILKPDKTWSKLYADW